MSNTKQTKTDGPTLCCPFGRTPGYPCRICRGSAVTAYNGMSREERDKRDAQARFSQSCK